MIIFINSFLHVQFSKDAVSKQEQRLLTLLIIPFPNTLSGQTDRVARSSDKQIDVYLSEGSRSGFQPNAYQHSIIREPANVTQVPSSQLEYQVTSWRRFLSV